MLPGDSVEAVLKIMRAHDLPGVPVVNEGGRCVGIITEADLIMAGENEDLHLPHYFELFGGFVFLESMSHFEERLQARRSPRRPSEMMTEDPVTIEADGDRARRRRGLIARKQAQPPAGDRARPARRRGDARRRARRADRGG